MVNSAKFYEHVKLTPGALLLLVSYCFIGLATAPATCELLQVLQ